MVLKEVVNLLDAEVLTGNSDPELELNSAFSSDMMSHMLAYSNDKSILITALYNPQVLRTARLNGHFLCNFYRYERAESALS